MFTPKKLHGDVSTIPCKTMRSNAKGGEGVHPSFDASEFEDSLKQAFHHVIRSSGGSS